MLHQIQYGTTTIQFELAFSDRKTLGIFVYPDRTVKVIAPAGTNTDKVYGKIEKRASWICKQLRKFKSIEGHEIKREYVSGETHKYLGRQYRLRVLKSDREDVKLSGKFFYVSTKDKNDTGKIKKLLTAWYLDHARDRFTERLGKCYILLKREGIRLPNMVIRKMEKRWGSCTEAGRIILNPELIKAPIDCIDYVIVHELCHLKVHNHSQKFYRLKMKYMPDWEKRKAKLEKLHF